MKLKRILSLLLALTMLFCLAGCEKESAEGESSYPDYKSLLTDESVKYDAETIDKMSAEEHHIYDKDVPALYNYFDNVKIGVAFTSNQMSYFGNEDIDLTQDFNDTNLNISQGILKHYNIYVLGNEMKSDHCNPAEGQYNFDDADKLVEIGKAAGAELRGHTIVWHSQVPQWWFKADPNDGSSLEDCRTNGTLATREQLEERLKTYINELIPRYKDTIKYWDVCNEVLNATGIRTVADSSYWAEIFGDVDGNGYADDYVEFAFNTVREVGGEDLVLMINDFNLEWQDTKVTAMYDMVERMLRKGVRIDGVGFQSHIGLDCDVEHYRRNIEKIASLSEVYDECFPDHKGNFRVQITELDMNMFVGGLSGEYGFHVWTDDDYARQADKYYALMDMFLDFADEGVIDAILFWGTDDDNSWLNNMDGKMRSNAALLADRNLELKPAFWAVARAGLEHKK